jgi:shikimate dehydrogenase
MIKAAVLGSPIAHSLSPLLHRTAYDFLGLENTYESIEVTDGQFKNFYNMNKMLDWTGFSLTMPLKEVAINLVDEVEERARQINSINTIYKKGDKWYAKSTDLLAFENIFANLTFNRVAVIGAGGTARAAIGALSKYADEVDVLLRSEFRIPALKIAGEGLKINPVQMDSDLSKYDLVVSTTPVGANDGLVKSIASVDGIFFDVLYKPIESKLAKVWKSAGGVTIDGLDLLVEQAIYQIEIFSKVNFDQVYMRNLLLSTGRGALEI